MASLTWTSLVGLVAFHVASAQGTIRGTVTSRVDGAPLDNVRITVAGTNLTVTSGSNGGYTILGAPVGETELRANRVGYQQASISVRIADGAETAADISLLRAPVPLPEVVTTATGQQRRVEVGNAIDNIDVATLMDGAPIRTLTDVINARVPGVLVEQGTQSGTGARVRIRGVGSMILSNDPIYIIDGVRLTSTTGVSVGLGINAPNPFTTFGNNPSRLGDLNPEEIESIEIAKGASAGTLYGTDAANGVIVITTKHGRPGAPAWSAFAEHGVVDDRNIYPNNYTLAGHSPTGALMIKGECTLSLVAAGACIKDSLRVYTPVSDPRATPLGYGSRSSAGIQLSGGNQAARFFASAARDDEVGVFRLPAFERDRYAASGVTPHEWTNRPNEVGKNTFRVNFGADVSPHIDASMSIAYVTSDQRFAIESNGTAGIGSLTFGGPGYSSNGLIACTCATTRDSLHGYRAWTPGYSWEERRGNTVNRSLVSGGLRWRPASWLELHANGGGDLTDRVESDLVLNGEGPPLSATYRNGFVGRARTNLTTLSADVGGTANNVPSSASWLAFRTTVGAQYTNFRYDQNETDGGPLPPGAQTVDAAASAFAGELFSLQKTLGWFVEERVGLRDRVFVTAALRSDVNSSVGSSSPRVYYPKAQLSWVLSDEEFFRRSPLSRVVQHVRPRIAFGQSGVQPRPTDAARQFGTGVASVSGIDQPYEVLTVPGNSSLRPERSTELEGGFDSRWFANHVSLDVTAYSRVTRDALVSVVVAPSLGSGTSTTVANVGAIKNAGIEGQVGAELVDRRSVAVDVNIATSITGNKVVSLGNTPRQIGGMNWIAEGYPIRGAFARPILGWSDKNKDGILTYSADPSRNEVFVGTDTIFRGYSEPRYMTSLGMSVSLFQRSLVFQSLVDWRGGNVWYNNTERIRCATRRNCNGLMNPAASLEEQAMVVAAVDDPSKTLDGYLQPGAFVKWREASATLRLPVRAVGVIGARSGTLSLSVRNLAKLTRYRGVDPESDYTATEGGDTPSEFQTFGAPTYMILRLGLRF